MKENLCRRPPLGLYPRYIWEEKVQEQRLEEIKEAIKRYMEAGEALNPEWLNEYNELVAASKAKAILNTEAE